MTFITHNLYHCTHTLFLFVTHLPSLISLVPSFSQILSSAFMSYICMYTCMCVYTYLNIGFTYKGKHTWYLVSPLLLSVIPTSLQVLLDNI